MCEYDFRISAAYSPAESQASAQNDGGSSQHEEENDDGAVSDSGWSFNQLEDGSDLFPDFNDLQFLGSSPPGFPSLALGLEDQDMQLLSHYHTHTSQIMTFLPDELPVLQTEIPNLASSCGALMHSLLALSAACLACDLLASLDNETPAASTGIATTIMRVQELLTAGDSHHAASMHEIQEYLVPNSSGSQSLNAVLANATLMAIYGSANHRAQAWLTRLTTSREESRVSSVAVLRFRWLFLFRAAHLAHRAFVGHQIQPSASGESGLFNFVASADIGASPPGESPHPLLTILCTTGPVAMDKLGESVLRGQRNDGDAVPSLNACATAFRVLNTIISTLGSNLGSSPLRRIVMSFLNRAPQEYFDIIQMGHDQDTSNMRARQLAMNILAHWLVLVMLLDEVWWIGDVGSWELRYVLDELGWGADDYWPASMYQIVQDTKQRTI